MFTKRKPKAEGDYTNLGFDNSYILLNLIQ